MSHQEKGRESPLASFFRMPDPQDETSEEQEVMMDKEVTPTCNISSSSPDEVVVPSPPSLADDIKQFQDFTKRISDSLQIPLEEVMESLHKLLRILRTSSSYIALRISEALLDLAIIIWHTPATIQPTCKRVDNKYAPSNDLEFLFSNPSPISLVVNTINKCGRQHHAELMPYGKGQKQRYL